MRVNHLRTTFLVTRDFLPKIFKHIQTYFRLLRFQREKTELKNRVVLKHCREPVIKSVILKHYSVFFYLSAEKLFTGILISAFKYM